jgi:phosphatidylserine/phosphatidylglycerophosphate/cardiolipin synthase-like enzyme
MVGTYNLDPRSERLNSEIAVIFEDVEVAATLGRSMDANLARSWRIGPNGRPEGQRERYPGATPGKKLKLRLVRLIEPFIRGQL